MINKVARPFLKWAGGKSQLLEQLEIYLPDRLKQGKIKRYIEPFLGGGAVFFYLRSKYRFDEVILNDINEELILTYRVVQNHVRELIEFLAELEGKYLEVDMERKQEIYYEQRDKFNKEKETIDYTSFSQEHIYHGARMIFLNKTCFNGLYRQNRKGQFNVPFGKRKNVTICDTENLLASSKTLEGVILENSDFEDIDKYVDRDTLLYLDPPYRPLSETSSFTDYSRIPFDDNSQIRLAKWVKSIGAKGASFLLSNSDPTNINPDDDFFERLYSNFQINKVKASRAINSKGNGRGEIRELLITNGI